MEGSLIVMRKKEREWFWYILKLFVILSEVNQAQRPTPGQRASYTAVSLLKFKSVGAASKRVRGLRVLHYTSLLELFQSPLKVLFSVLCLSGEKQTNKQ